MKRMSFNLGGKLEHNPFPYEYVCTLSTACRLIAMGSNERGRKKFQGMIEDTVRDFEENKELKTIMKSDALRAKENQQILRRVDIIKDEGGEIFLVVFMSWNTSLNCWHALVQLPAENEFSNNCEPLAPNVELN